MTTRTLTFRVSGMHCGSCSLLIDDVLEDLPGVTRTQTSAKDGRSVVQLDVTQTRPADIIDAITQAGYHAEQLT